MGQVFEGYKGNNHKDEIINGVKIHRCFTIARRTGAIFRVLNYYSYMISSTLYVNHLADDYDVVFVNQLSPVMMAQAGLEYKKRHHKKLVLYCLDLWPESLTVGGIKKNGLVYKIYHRVSERIYKQADKILITSKSFADYFKNEFGITDTYYLPQYAETIFNPQECRKESDEYLDLMFAGNIGKAQSIETIIEAARLTQNEEKIRWHIVGDGSELESLKKRALGLNNVFFYGRKPLEEMPKYYAMADAMLVTLIDDPVISLTLPGKVQTYMAAGKPIIAAAGGETEMIINEARCGYCIDIREVNNLVESVMQLEKNRNDLVLMAEHSLQYSKDEFGKQRLIGVLDKHLH